MPDSDIKKFKRYVKDNNLEIFVKSLCPDKFKNIVTNVIPRILTHIRNFSAILSSIKRSCRLWQKSCTKS